VTPLLLWFNFVTFAILLVGFGFELLGWVRQRERWRALYVWYIALYTIWILVQTFAYFAVSYLTQVPSWLPSAVSFIWVAASAGMMLVVPHYIVRVSGFTPGKLGTALLYLPAAATLAALMYAIRAVSQPAAVATNLCFNGLIGALMVVGAIRVWKRKSTVPRHEVLPFLVLSSLLYLFLLALSVLLAAGAASRGSELIANGAAGAFCLPWGILLVVTGLRRAGAAARDAGGLPSRFLDDFAISPREADIIGLLLRGAANREISEKLFISSRTVEAHIYNIYRKCDCRNRVELVNRLQQYRPAP
jgi:DNA-binding CsgD family transcriptional regulator